MEAPVRCRSAPSALTRALERADMAAHRLHQLLLSGAGQRPAAGSDRDCLGELRQGPVVIESIRIWYFRSC